MCKDFGECTTTSVCLSICHVLSVTDCLSFCLFVCLSWSTQTFGSKAASKRALMLRNKEEEQERKEKEEAEEEGEKGVEARWN